MAASVRVFKDKAFAKDAKKAGISDTELLEAINEVMNGQGVDLGGGVFKKRLNKNMHRSIILTKSRDFWIYQYLFAKNDQDNISANDLIDLKELVKMYKTYSTIDIQALINRKSLIEIERSSQ